MISPLSPNRRRARPLWLCLAPGVAIALSCSRPGAHAAPASAISAATQRPRYDLALKMDWELLTLSATAKIDVPASNADPLADASFFLYANADGVGGASKTQRNLIVDGVLVNGQSAAWTLDGPVLKVKFAAPQSQTVRVEVRYHGLVPRSAAESGMAGLMGTDVSGLLGMGGATKGATEKAKNTDYGLYTATPQIVSLGSFWSPTLAVRQGGHWADAPPSGLGDVAYAQKSDYHVSLDAPPAWTIVGPGQVTRQGSRVEIAADDVRDCAILASREFVAHSKTVQIGQKSVVISAYGLKEHAARLAEATEIAASALQIYSKRFGNYPFGEFKVVEAPMKSGAGGMEYSRMVGIASSIYEPMSKQLGSMITSLNLPGADQLLAQLDPDGSPKGAATAPTESNPTTDMLGSLIGSQKVALDSLFEETIAHEVAHQWWAIGVGSDSQRDPWLDESLTNWSSMLYFEDRYGRAQADQMRELHLKTSYSMGAALGGGDAPANLPTDAYTGNLQYGAIVYGKAALFYDHLRSLVGDPAFFGALRDYYARYNGKLAGPKTLRGLMEERAPEKRAQIEALYVRWIEEKHGAQDIGAGAAGDLTQMLGGLLGGGAGGMDGGDG